MERFAVASERPVAGIPGRQPSGEERKTISDAMNDIEKALYELNEQADILIDRISPVLISEVPQIATPVDPGAKHPLRLEQAAVVEGMLSRRFDISRVTEKLARARERVMI